MSTGDQTPPVDPDEHEPDGNEGDADAQPEPVSVDWAAALTAMTPAALADLAGRAKERDDFLERMQRLQAETDNMRKRMRREQADRMRQASAGLIGDLLPALDNLDAALQSARALAPEPGSQLASFVEGVENVAGQMRSILASHGVTPIDESGVPFDPAVHEAVLTAASPDHPDDHVVAVFKTGYRLHDRVLRAAQVQVNKNPD